MVSISSWRPFLTQPRCLVPQGARGGSDRAETPIELSVISNLRPLAVSTIPRPRMWPPAAVLAIPPQQRLADVGDHPLPVLRDRFDPHRRGATQSQPAIGFKDRIHRTGRHRDPCRDERGVDALTGDGALPLVPAGDDGPQ